MQPLLSSLTVRPDPRRINNQQHEKSPSRISKSSTSLLTVSLNWRRTAEYLAMRMRGRSSWRHSVRNALSQSRALSPSFPRSRNRLILHPLSPSPICSWVNSPTLSSISMMPYKSCVLLRSQRPRPPPGGTPIRTSTPLLIESLAPFWLRTIFRRTKEILAALALEEAAEAPRTGRGTAMKRGAMNDVSIVASPGIGVVMTAAVARAS